MPAAYDDATALQRAVRRLGASTFGSRIFAPTLHRIDEPVYRLTRGRVSFTGVLTGLPMVLLTTTGARSGQPRRVPLVGLPSTEGLVIFGSNYGQAHTPAWVHNLRADPNAVASIDGRSRRVHAVLAQGERRERIWAEGLAVYPGFSVYERRAEARRITVWILEDGVSS